MKETVTNLFLSSTDASSIESNGSRFRFSLKNPIQLPEKCFARIISFSCFFDFPNIIASDGTNKMTFTYGVTPYSIFLPQGSYSLEDIQETIDELLLNNGINIDIKLQGDEATGKVSLLIDRKGNSFSMDFDVDNKLFKDRLGFTGSTTDPALTWIEGSTRASLNVVNQILVYLSFVRGNVLSEKTGTQVAGIIPINTISRGRQIIHYPSNPFVSQVSDRLLDSVYVYLTNENGVEIITSDPIILGIEIFENK